MKRTRIALVAGLSLLATTLAYAAGFFPGFPITGGAAYCTSYLMNPITGAATTTCNGPQTLAGPTVPTGDELIPADTQLSGGRPPQSVFMSMRSLNAAPVAYNLCAAAACGSVTVANNSGGVLFDYSTTIDSATVVTPLSPMDKQRFIIASPYTISSLTVTANTGSTLAVTTPTVLTASTTVSQGYEFQYVSSTAKWYKIR